MYSIWFVRSQILNLKVALFLPHAVWTRVEGKEFPAVQNHNFKTWKIFISFVFTSLKIDNSKEKNNLISDFLSKMDICRQLTFKVILVHIWDVTLCVTLISNHIANVTVHINLFEKWEYKNYLTKITFGNNVHLIEFLWIVKLIKNFQITE